MKNTLFVDFVGLLKKLFFLESFISSQKQSILLFPKITQEERSCSTEQKRSGKTFRSTEQNFVQRRPLNVWSNENVRSNKNVRLNKNVQPNEIVQPHTILFRGPNFVQRSSTFQLKTPNGSTSEFMWFSTPIQSLMP